jgi:hypothetical protein
VQGEAELGDGQRRVDDDAGTAGQGDVHGTPAALGPCGREARDGGVGELGEGGLAVREVGVGLDDTETEEDAAEADPDDLEEVGDVGGRQARQGEKDGGRVGLGPRVKRSQELTLERH